MIKLIKLISELIIGLINYLYNSIRGNDDETLISAIELLVKIKKSDPNDFIINFKNIHGDIETCKYRDYRNQNRSSGQNIDIINLYLSELPDKNIIVRRELKSIKIDNNIIPVNQKSIDRIFKKL